MAKRVFVDAPQDVRCQAVVALHDRSTAQCGRRAAWLYLGWRFCTQHKRIAVRTAHEAKAESFPAPDVTVGG